MNKKTCFVCELGWIIIGIVERRTDEAISLRDASVVRKWSNGKGIGGIAKVMYKDDYTLDAIGDVVIYKSKVLFEIPCEW